MKWIFMLSLGWLSACGQGSAGTDKAVTEIFNSKYVRLVDDTSRMMLIENVVIRYGDLYVEADSALLDKPKQTVTAFGIKKALFKENIIAERCVRENNPIHKGRSKVLHGIR